MGKPQKQQRFTELDYDGQKQEMHLISVIINYMVSLSLFFFFRLQCQGSNSGQSGMEYDLAIEVHDSEMT